MTTRAARLLVLGLLFSIGSIGLAAQITIQGTPPPATFADDEPWYRSGLPIALGGTVYYPSGPITHFSANEMVPAGMFERVTVYRRTTREPNSIVYVPLSGGLVRPYERRRSGPLAGTVGSTPPSFPVVLPAEEAMEPARSAPPAAPLVPRAVGTSGFAVGVLPMDTRPAIGAAHDPAAVPVGTSGAARTPAIDEIPRPQPETARRPVGIHDVFVRFHDTRWFAAGRAVEHSTERFTRIGEYQGFPVYRASGEDDLIFIAHVAGSPGLLAPYRSR
jgi:hypothetical protein